MKNIAHNIRSQATIIGLLLSGFGCSGIGAPGELIFSEDTKDRYLVLRKGRPGYVQSISTEVPNRPELKRLREVHGGLKFICSEIHGVSRPRLVVETKNSKCFQVVYQWGDYDALKSLGKPLGLVIAEEEREILCATIRESPGGHRMKVATTGKTVVPENVLTNADGSVFLDGATLNDLARYLEICHYRPVVNKTGLNGRWCINLSENARKRYPTQHSKVMLDDLGLELKLENAKVLVTVVKDAQMK
jgi:hypothetical protein